MEILYPLRAKPWIRYKGSARRNQPLVIILIHRLWVRLNPLPRVLGDIWNPQPLVMILIHRLWVLGVTG